MNDVTNSGYEIEEVPDFIHCVTFVDLLIVKLTFYLFIGHSHYNLRMFGSEHVSRVRQLYKLIFRVHRALPGELRIMGDNYAREEFKRHKNCNLEEARIFLNEWTDYAINIAKQMKPLQQAKRKTVGKYMDPQLLEHMTDDQIVQLYELHKAATLTATESDQQNSEKK